MKQPHICLDETLGIRYAILPGDPARLDRIAKELEDVQELAYNREFRSLRGRYKGVDVLALSTGIGGSSAGIAVEELHNIGVQAAIRIGSCGALQKGIALGDLILVCGAVRDDGASKAYVDVRYPAVADPVLLNCCMESAKALGCRSHVGLAHSHESFYHEENEQESAYWSSKRVGVARKLRKAEILRHTLERMRRAERRLPVLCLHGGFQLVTARVPGVHPREFADHRLRRDAREHGGEAKVPMNRGCLPIDVARAVMYCVEQKYETGQAIPVTGGQVMLN